MLLRLVNTVDTLGHCFRYNALYTYTGSCAVVLHLFFQRVHITTNNTATAAITAKTITPSTVNNIEGMNK